MGLAVASVACLAPLGIAAGAGWYYGALLATTFLVLAGKGLLFLLKPSRERARLESAARLYGAVSHGGLVLALLLQHGAVVP